VALARGRSAGLVRCAHHSIPNWSEEGRSSGLVGRGRRRSFFIGGRLEAGAGGSSTGATASTGAAASYNGRTPNRDVASAGCSGWTCTVGGGASGGGAGAGTMEIPTGDAAGEGVGDAAVGEGAAGETTSGAVAGEGDVAELEGADNGDAVPEGTDAGGAETPNRQAAPATMSDTATDATLSAVLTGPPPLRRSSTVSPGPRTPAAAATTAARQRGQSGKCRRTRARSPFGQRPAARAFNVGRSRQS
jgi:hypothetical protein